MIKKIFLFAIAVVLLSECKTSTIDPKDIPDGKEYYPLHIGNYAIYAISVHTKVAGGFDTLNYQLKELVSDTFKSGGETFYRLERFTRLQVTSPWPENPDSVWTVRISQNRLIKTENNVPYIKLIFPVKEAGKWDGNALNTLSEDEYTYTAIAKPYTVNTKTYPNTVSVSKQEEISLIKRNTGIEVYAKDIGLVLKKQEALSLDFSTGDTTSGYIYTQTLQEKYP